MTPKSKKGRIRFDCTNEMVIMFHLNRLNELIKRLRSLGKNKRSVSMLQILKSQGGKVEEDKKEKKKENHK